jgi:ribosomal protein L32E
MNIAIRYRDRVDSSMFLPQVNWRKPTNVRNLKPQAAPVPAVSG